jgi:glycosyltransferase involved in cell wall biosynthesis
VDAGCEVVYYDVVGKGLLGYLKNLPALRREIRAHQPDVIHAHYSLCGFLATLSFSSIPVVVSLMGSDVLTSGVFYKWLLRLWGSFFWKKVIVKSEEMYNVLRIRDALIVPNGVNKMDFFHLDRSKARKQLGWGENLVIALFASDPSRPEKNYDLFKRAVQILHSRGVDIIEKHLHNLSKEEMMLYYNAANILVLTSFHEGSPNVIKEAMFCDCPFVTVRVGDVEGWLKITKGNFLVDYDAEQVANAMSLALEINHRVDNQLAIQELDAQRIADKLKSMYIGLLDEQDEATN